MNPIMARYFGGGLFTLQGKRMGNNIGCATVKDYTKQDVGKHQKLLPQIL